MALSRGVPSSPDLERICNLPKRLLDLQRVSDLTPVFRKPGGKMSLWPIQSAALWEIERAKGGLFPIGVGHGKTLIALLAGDALNAERPLVLVPPSLRDQMLRVDIPRYSEHFRFRVPKVLAYSELSSQAGAGALEEYGPDLVIADEAHSLKLRESARTKRFLFYMQWHPECRFVALSGTMAATSLRDYSHLAKIALGTGSPLPLQWGALEDWCAALDANVIVPVPEGHLKRLCEDTDHDHSTARERFRCRLSSTVGVVCTDESALGASLIIHGRDPAIGVDFGTNSNPRRAQSHEKRDRECLGGVRDRGRDSKGSLPPVVSEALARLRETWCRPDGEEISDALSFSRYARQVAQGFYLRWAWPQGEVDHAWLSARAAWHKEIRAYLSRARAPGRDSPGFVAAMAEADPESWPAWREWAPHKDKAPPPSEVVWLSDYLARDAAEWLKDGGIVWVNHPCMGERVAELSGHPFYHEASQARDVEQHQGPMILSSGTFNKGINIQARYSRMLFTHVPGVLMAEQAIGRLHRPGQPADEVAVDIYLHTEELRARWEKTKEEAEAAKMTNGRQKILLATLINA